MVNKQKVKGTNFERDVVDYLNEKLPGKFKRIPGSGAMGTFLKEGLLTGDVIGKVDNIPKQFRIECKVGYGGATQLTLKKEWIDKIIQEAENTFSIPVLIGKFSGARSGVRQFAVLDIETFVELLTMLSEAKDGQ